MPTDPLLKQKDIKRVWKDGLGQGVPDSGCSWYERFTMPRQPVIRQPHTEVVCGSRLPSNARSGKRRGDYGP